MDEIWKQIDDYPKYQISNYGHIRRDGRVLKGGTNSRGYRRIALSDRKRKTRRTVASMVAAAFIGPRPTGYTINHKDGNIINNRSDNLEYLTRLDNYIHSIEVLGRRVKYYGNKKFPHGTDYGYKKKCRCDKCVTQNRLRARRCPSSRKRRMRRLFPPAPWWGVIEQGI